MIGVEPYFAAIGTTCPFFKVSFVPTGADRLVAVNLGVFGMLVVLGIVLNVGMNAILFIAEHIVVIGDALQQVDGLFAAIPGLLGELDATRWSKGRNLVLHLGDAMVDKHRTHGEPRPIHTVSVDVKGDMYLEIGWNTREGRTYTADGLDNDSFVTAVSLPETGTRLTIDSVSDVDWFKFTLDATGRSSSYIGIDFKQWAGDLDLYLYDANGNLLDYARIDRG